MSFNVATGDSMANIDILSNLSLIPIFLDGEEWKSTEHYYQKCKFVEPSVIDRIRKAKSPLHAAFIGQTRDYKILPQWESIKVEVMERAIKARFEQHPVFAEMLMATDGELHDKTSVDDYWGIGFDGKGQNITGKILMKLRTELQDHRF